MESHRRRVVRPRGVGYIARAGAPAGAAGAEGARVAGTEEEDAAGYSRAIPAMPTCEYECSRCGHRFERFRQMSAEPVGTCPECSAAIRRLTGAGAGVTV